jgi:hypothetical protein
MTKLIMSNMIKIKYSNPINCTFHFNTLIHINERY